MEGMNMKKLLCTFLSVLLLSTICITVYAEDNQSEALNVRYLNQGHTKGEIIAQYNTLLSGLVESSPYLTEPSVVSPYQAGTLKMATLQNGLNMLNFARFLCGMNDVELDDTYTANCQTGALILESSLQFTHTPENILEMNEALFTQGASACASSILTDSIGGSNNALSAIISSHLDGYQDSGLLNRQKLLNPLMGKTGFGLIGYTSLIETADSSNTENLPDYVAWPAAGYFPIERFFGSGDGLDWSLHLDDTIYGKEYTEDLTIAVQNKKTDTIVILTQSETVTAGHFSVIKTADRYGYSLLFKCTDSVVNNGDEFSVTVSGLKDGNGNNLPDIHYDTAFFSLKDPQVEIQSYQVSFTNNRERINTGETVTYCVKLMDQNNQELIGSEITVSIAGDLLDLYTDENGEVRFLITPEAPYSVRVFVPGNTIGNAYYIDYFGEEQYIVPYTYGDITFDCIVNSADLVMLRKSLLGIYELNSSEETAADLNADEMVDIIDLIKMKKIISRII